MSKWVDERMSRCVNVWIPAPCLLGPCLKHVHILDPCLLAMSFWVPVYNMYIC